MFELFISGLPDKAKILDLGCGHGTPVAKLLSERGHRIVGVDRSKALLAVAASELPQHQWVLSDLETYEPHDLFDGIVIWDSMFHLPRNEHLKLLKKAYSVLSPAGMLILSSGGSENDIPPFTDSMFNREFFYDAFPVSQLLAHCEALGFSVIKSVLVNVPDGKRDKGRLGMVLRRS